MFDLIIRGDNVVTPQGTGTYDICIEGGTIAAMMRPGAVADDQAGRVIDATGKIVIPGGIDPHIHSLWHIPAIKEGGDVTMTDGPDVVSRAAIHGGTTTLLDFANVLPGQTAEEAINIRKQDWSGKCYADYGYHIMLQGAIEPELLPQIGEAIQDGYPSIKIFTTDITPSRRGRKITHGHIWEIFKVIKKEGGIGAIHAEDDEIVMHMYDVLTREGRTGFENLAEVHNTMSEDLRVSSGPSPAPPILSAWVRSRPDGPGQGRSAPGGRADVGMTWAESPGLARRRHPSTPTLELFATEVSSAVVRPVGYGEGAMRKLNILAAALILTWPMAAAAAERPMADVSCQATDQKLVYDCMISLKGKKSETPIDDAEIVIKADMPSMPMAHNVPPVKAMAAGKPGVYHAKIELEMHGDWTLTMDVSGPIRDRLIKRLYFGMEGTAQAKGMKHDHGHKMHRPSRHHCQETVHLSEAAERQPGGALYIGPEPDHADHIMKSVEEIPQMRGSHHDHKAPHGGELLMAKNKLHHLEILYSRACGLRIFMYNAFTKSIAVDRFQAFVLIVPEEDSRFYEAIRFLTPSADASVLRTALDHAGDEPFEVEIYMKFPERDEPEIFRSFLRGNGH